MGEELLGCSPSMGVAGGRHGRFMLTEQEDNGMADSDNSLLVSLRPRA